MIHEFFDPASDPLITPEHFYGEHPPVCDICLVVFSQQIHRHLLETFPCEKVGEMGACNGRIPIYKTEYQGVPFVFYLTMIGSCGAGTGIQESRCITGAKHYIMFGSAGCLDRAASGKIVVPTAAYRDEGFSYHYVPADDYISIRNAPFVAETFEKAGIPFVTGKTWTTDAIYRETAAKTRRLRDDGCLTVEMECAGAQAVCDYLGVDYYDYLFCGDLLDAPAYEIAGLDAANHALGNLAPALVLIKACAERQ
jgi:nucleoside phosphorylase